MKLNYLNKFYILLIFILLFKIGFDLVREIDMKKIHYYFSKERTKLDDKKFELHVEAGSESTMPMDAIVVNFIDYSRDIQSTKIANYKWGNGDGKWSIDDEYVRVPKYLETYWFSYTEDKFFTGYFKLPQKKIYDMLEEDHGITSSNYNGKPRPERYNTLLLGIAPKGLVTLWIKNYEIGTKEIYTFEAKETIVDWNKSIYSQYNRKEIISEKLETIPKFVQEEIKHNKISNVYYKERLKRYNYTISTNRSNFKIYDYDIDFVNREVINTQNSGLNYLTDITVGKAIPITVTLYIESPLSPKLKVRIHIGLLDGKSPNQDLEPLEQRAYYNQLINRFKTFFEKNKEVQLYIKFNDKIVESNINKPVYSGKVCLKSPTQEVEIPNSKVEVYYIE